MQEGKVLIIKNPVAGKNAKKKNKMLLALTDTLAKKHETCKVCVMSKPGDAMKFIGLYAKDMDVVVCCGGDGTLSEVVNGLIDIDLIVPVCFFPIGTTNDVARTLHLTQNVGSVMKGTVRYQDTGQFNGGKHLTYIAAFGAFANVPYKTPQWLKNRLGYGAYILYSIKSFFAIKPHGAVIKADDQVFEGKFLFGSVSNSTSIGGIIKFDKEDVDLQDGRMELLAVSYPRNLKSFFRLLFNILKNNYRCEDIIFIRANNFSFSFTKAAEWTIDGEFGGKHQRVEIEVKDKAFSILAPDMD